MSPGSTVADRAAIGAALAATATFARLVDALQRDQGVSAGNLWGSSQALVLSQLLGRHQGPWLAVTSSEAEAEAFTADLVTFGCEPLHLPARDSERMGDVDASAVRARLQLAQALAGPPERRPRLIVASQLSILQPLPDATQLESQFLHLHVGQELDVEAQLERLVAAGYTREPLAEAPGEVSLRGDVLDVFAFAADVPLRIELFDDQVESLRTFDPETQRSIENQKRAAICLAADVGGIEDGHGAAPAALLAPTAVFVEVEPLRIEDCRGGLRGRSTSHSHALAQFLKVLARHPLLQLQSLPTGRLDFDAKTVQRLAVGLPASPGALQSVARAGRELHVFCKSEVELERFEALLAEHGHIDGLQLRLGEIAKGFELPDAGIVCVNHHELAGVGSARRVKAEHRPHRVRALRSFFELKIGDLVVHAVHGLARYLGLERMARSGGEEDHLHLEFAEEVSVFVPACRIDLVQRYIGTGGSAPKLDKLGSGAFRKRKDKVEKALQDLAADLLELQAVRETRKREPWDSDDKLVEDMLRAFPYTDTIDQASADKEITADLTGTRPMDRLLCGDVGFGKTEVAVRAAFRVVAAGGQVAVLVPTTVLAGQHERSFRRRLAGFPVRVEALSRINSGKTGKTIVADVESGRVDILIGTHRILSKDVRFQRLGLVIIDEEQRFGVKHKEHFKSLRATVDVLALSATPIPRTLHMSLSGVRDISALSVPPEGRHDVETKICNRDDLGLIRDAILREKERGGQVFFLHNRVTTINGFADEMRQLVPECTFAIGHGQMSARELARVMGRFELAEVDVLVATTIIENGIDIPAAGTMLIDDADRFGLGELHQLRGRVGRGGQKPYCYLLVDRTRPMRAIAKERLKALEELSHLGAGFQISMKDLEIRGAGNLLGPEQSGHIAAIGYDMYCRLLKQTVDMLKSGSLSTESIVAADVGLAPGESVELELGVRAYIPEDWVPASDDRLELLRRLDSIHEPAEAVAVQEELRDRFGRVPPETRMLLRVFRLRAALLPIQVTRLAWREDCYLLEFADRVLLESAFARDGIEIRPLRQGVALLVLPRDVKGPEAGLAWLEKLLL
ncbi:transcription-repair coupling factor [Engelhardtia mirabilis]|uniref:Transcription-repair-coupling factor n=1 Tax=Engelhardtia mirabilis TaxID=2528011 RepID=A0A518BRK7_9BACT|nr:Transcription-repair-coupling factor [Planctomycetes bacterium Pla133]QDV03934.1 Transcription-repair-coupling factor [Planctomycetes bacterium Pla86]